MAIKIIKASDPLKVERLNMVIYGPPGIGKTSLAFTADAPLLLDFDNGSYRSANRKDTVIIQSWTDVAGITADDLAGFKTIIIDTAGRALDVLSADIIRANPKHGRGGSLSLQGWGELKARFTAFLKMLNTFGKDVILIAHMDEQRSGDEVIERLDVQGGSKGEVYKAADAMGRLVMRDGNRWLLFSPSDAAFGKNPAQLPALQIPDQATPDFTNFLECVIGKTKEHLNRLTEAQKATVDEIHWFADALPNITNVDDINGLIERAKSAPAMCKIALNERAKELDFTFDKAQGLYVSKAEPIGNHAEAA